MNEEQSAEKSWLVYGSPYSGLELGAQGIGRFFHQSSGIENFLYCKGQQYFPERGSLKQFKFFQTSAEAVDYLLENQCPFLKTPLSVEDTTKKLLHDFPTAMKQEALSQTSPK
jgi:hypothetical protein